MCGQEVSTSQWSTMFGAFSVYICLFVVSLRGTARYTSKDKSKFQLCIFPRNTQRISVRAKQRTRKGSLIEGLNKNIKRCQIYRT